MAKNANLHSAKKVKNDEFYTRFADIEGECAHYKPHFQGKTVLCNCDDPRVSNFFRYFFLNFHKLGLTRLIATCCKNLNPDLFGRHQDGQAVYCIYDGTVTDDRFKNIEEFVKQNEWGILRGGGDFRSDECIELLQQTDIVCTNPPFSLFREYVAQLMEYNKKFIIIGNKNAITYKEIFPLIKENKLWCGFMPMGIDMLFDVPPEVAEQFITEKKKGSTYRIVNGIVRGRSQSMWFTNLDHAKRHEELFLYKRYSSAEYPKYDNYDAIEVGKTVEIPMDYDGVMGVPISFLDKYNPEQFEILGSADDKNYYPIIFGKNEGRITVQGKQTFKRLFIRRIKM